MEERKDQSFDTAQDRDAKRRAGDEEPEQPIQEEIPAHRQQPAAVTAIQFHSMTLAEKAKYAASFGLPSAAILEIMGAGGGGLGLALVIGFASGYWSEEIKSGLIDKLPAPREKT